MTYVLIFLLMIKGELLARAAIAPSLEACNTAVAQIAIQNEEVTAICIAVNPKDAT